MRSFITALTLAVCVFSSGTLSAKAFSSESEGRAPAASATIAEYELTLAPLQFVKFCMNYEDECAAASGNIGLTSSSDAMSTLSEVNLSVNRAIQPMHKSTEPLEAHWTLSPAAGDCNDYAVTKRHRLIAMGWPTSALRLAAVRTPEGQGHLVLIAKLKDGDFVLDNLSDQIRLWSSVNYDWISMQSAENPRFWVMIGEAGRQRHLRLMALRQDKSASAD